MSRVRACSFTRSPRPVCDPHTRFLSGRESSARTKPPRGAPWKTAFKFTSDLYPLITLRSHRLRVGCLVSIDSSIATCVSRTTPRYISDRDQGLCRVPRLTPAIVPVIYRTRAGQRSFPFRGALFGEDEVQTGRMTYSKSGVGPLSFRGQLVFLSCLISGNGGWEPTSQLTRWVCS